MPFPLLPLAGLALGAGGLGYSIFGTSAPKAPDISDELRRIRDLFDQARAAAIQSINYEATQARGQATANLAARGTYRSPVAENVYGKLQESRLRAIGAAEGALAGQQAKTQADVLNQLLGYNLAGQQAGAQREAAIAGGLTSFGGSLLMPYLWGREGSPTTRAPLTNLGPSGDGQYYPVMPGQFNFR